MSQRVSLGGESAKPVERIEVEVFDRVFVSRPMTRSVGQRVKELEAKLDELADEDAAVAVFGELIDVLTEPTNGQKKKAGALIVEAWQGERLEVAQIAAFVEQIQEAAAAARPT